MSVELIAENNRLIKESLFSKKLIKCLQNIMHFSIQLKTNCKCNENQLIIHQNEHHFQSYHTLRDLLYGDNATNRSVVCHQSSQTSAMDAMTTPKTTTTEMTKVCHHCQQPIMTDKPMASDGQLIDQSVALKPNLLKSLANDRPKTKTGNCLMTALPMPLKCFGCDHLFTKCDHFLNHINRETVTKKYANKWTETCDNQPGNQRPIDRKSLKIPIYTVTDGYRCGYKGCKYTTKLRKHVVFHFTAHKSYRPYRCTANDCKQWFKTDAHLRSHQLVVHPEQFPNRQWLECPTPDCPYKTKVNSSLTKHLRSHSRTSGGEPPVRYQCTECDKSYARQRTLDEHRQVTHTRDIEYRCSQCDKNYTCLSALKTHVKQTHYKVFECVVNACGQQFVSELELRSHGLLIHQHNLTSSGVDISTLDAILDEPFADITIQHSPEPQPIAVIKKSVTKTSKVPNIPIYPCDDGYRCGYSGCQYTAKRETLVMKHTIAHTSDRPYRCRLNGCKLRFKTESVLNGHQISVHPDQFPDRPWLTCPTDGCPYRTKGNTNMCRHVRTHTHRYGCDECDKTYSTRLSLVDHKRSVHPEVDGQLRRVYGCQQCDKTYPVMRKLRAHIQQTHNRVYACDFTGCDKQFGVQSHLQLHRQRVHDKSYVRPVPCVWKGCEQRFDCNSKMREHLNKHSGARPFLCLHCGQQFATTGDRSAHVSNQHRDRQYACQWPDCQYKAAFASRLRTHMRKHRVK